MQDGILCVKCFDTEWEKGLSQQLLTDWSARPAGVTTFQVEAFGIRHEEDEVKLNSIQRPSPYRAVNTLRLGYKNQSVNIV